MLIYQLRESEVAEALRQHRHDMGMSLRDVAGRTGISAATVSRIERGKVGGASLVEILALCNCYEVSIDELLSVELEEEIVTLRKDLDDLRAMVESDHGRIDVLWGHAKGELTIK